MHSSAIACVNCRCGFNTRAASILSSTEVAIGKTRQNAHKERKNALIGKAPGNGQESRASAASTYTERGAHPASERREQNARGAGPAD